MGADQALVLRGFLLSLAPLYTRCTHSCAQRGRTVHRVVRASFHVTFSTEMP